ncbi:MAG TPA: rhomboid family intramembrane serine protease [Pyrinomonadaceae bacterium]|nr:rhomboid family intramembrane serine protease [Pyrinomonadaceae bacterium]
MIFPIGDDNTDRTTTPILNYVLIAINVLVFVLLQGGGTNDKFTYAYSTVPQEIKTGEDIARPVPIEVGDQRGTINLQPTPPTVYITLLTSMFMHGGWMHLLGNMLFLWIFGDNLEHVMGRMRYLIFYLVTGLAASLAHVIATFGFGDNPYIPSLGASGAISGVLGGYLVLFPKRQVKVIMLRMLTSVPAIVAIGLWFVLQLVQAFGVIAAGPQSGGGVAFMAHVGGFVAGLILVKLFTIGRNTAAAAGRQY